MKKILVLPAVAAFLVGCGSEYDELIDDAISYHHEKGNSVDEDVEIRENAEVMVWDDGRYVSAIFFDEEGNEEGDFIVEHIRGNLNFERSDTDRMRENADADYRERFGEEID